jgi:hypothetical protein
VPILLAADGVEDIAAARDRSGRDDFSSSRSRVEDIAAARARSGRDDFRLHYA